MGGQFFKRSATWLADRIRSADSVEIIYRRGIATVTLDATLTRPENESDEIDGGQVVDADIREFIVTSAELRLDGHPIDPAAGDTIDVHEGGVTEHYEVTPFDDEGHVFRPSDPHGVQIRIHSVRTK